MKRIFTWIVLCACVAVRSTERLRRMSLYN